MKKQVNIHIGGFYASSEPAIISTVLGSCVAACIFDPRTGIGGMNHILLPGRADIGTYNNPARYAINAMELLINDLMKLGAGRYSLKAKVFGGGQVLDIAVNEGLIGLKNAEFVIEYLYNEKIDIVNYSIGGTYSRKLFFHTDTGDVFLKKIGTAKISKKNSDTEKEILKRLKKKLNAPGRVTYFD